VDGTLGWIHTKALSTLATSRRIRRQSNSATVAVFGDSRRIRRLSPKTATVAEFGDRCRRIRRQIVVVSGPNSATIVASVDRALLPTIFGENYPFDGRKCPLCPYAAKCLRWKQVARMFYVNEYWMQGRKPLYRTNTSRIIRANTVVSVNTGLRSYGSEHYCRHIIYLQSHVDCTYISMAQGRIATPALGRRCTGLQMLCFLFHPM